MASDGQIVFEVTADGKRAIADIKDITKAIQQETGKWDKAADESANHMGSSFDGMLKKLVAGFSAAKVAKALLDFGKQAVAAASALEEVQNVVDVTFGKNAGQIETWAKNAGKQFGLTETQAKKFTSTMGAMLKSSGMAGDEIVQVSTDLAGLAADMASFYNLDFEEAFSKIRSGISGQTMPLKELGIDMSVATLNAFALQQGLTKTFDQMSQSEQTMLRYQYLMQATADAQGDFARTSDGYANKVRQLQTSIENIKTALGQAFLTPVTEATSVLEHLLSKLVPTEDETVIDKVAKIDIDKETKIKEIEAVAAVVKQLLSDMGEISSNKDVAQVVANLAQSANKLDSTSATHWEGVLSALQGIDGLQNLFGSDESAVKNISDLALALSGNSPTMSQAEAWQALLGTLSDNAEAVSALTGDSVAGTKQWLEGLAASAKELKPGDVDAWQQLMTTLLSGVDLETPEGRKFVDSLVESFLAMGSGSEEAIAALSSLGFTTDQISDKQAQWLAYCRELVKTIPGLSSIIDTNTGEIKGGIPALKEYADEWERTAKYQAEIEAIRAKKQVYSETTDPALLGADVSVARSKAVAQLKLAGYDETEINRELAKLDSLMQKAAEAGQAWETVKENALNVKTTLGFDVDTVSGATVTQMQAAVMGTDASEFNWINSLTGKAEDAVLEYAEAVHNLHETELARPLVLESIAEDEKAVAEAYGVTTDEIDAQTETVKEAEVELTKYEKALAGDADAQNELATAITNASDALQAMADYAEETRKSVESAIESVVHGFEKVDYHTYKSVSENIDSIKKSLEGLEEGSDAWDKQHKELEKYNDQLITTGTIYKNLESQQQFLSDYLANISKAQKMGLDANLLAELSDGSVESAMYLDALVNDTKGGKTIAQINELYRDIQEKKNQLSGTLTDNQLTVDQVYQGLVNEAKKAVDELATLGAPAADNASAMVDAIATGVGEEEGAVKTAVDGIIAQLDRLASLSYSPTITLGLGGLFSFFIPQHETGLDRVPFDGYLASLHEGEGILTAEENRVWQRFKNGRGEAVDYDTMGGVMRDNIKAGGNVYLDGRIVGSVISDQQGKTYRQLQRSGWQA